MQNPVKILQTKRNKRAFHKNKIIVNYFDDNFYYLKAIRWNLVLCKTFCLEVDLRNINWIYFNHLAFFCEKVAKGNVYCLVRYHIPTKYKNSSQKGKPISHTYTLTQTQNSTILLVLKFLVESSRFPLDTNPI